ncbi:family 5 hypothetical beta glucosidase from glycoside dehydrogenase [Russula earlei]|uniref:Family 5 hypothetical beta glucosidase from glycoside dehydrogenase n=1 Tax=Russula earlei TaxID=71964 RepID=A0ACC0UDD4_9AGAM|nr:family 5 hypothetical beta glucosidase from glycoside dehydrogenase [Russula earlei]
MAKSAALMQLLIPLLSLLTFSRITAAQAPSKIYGVNLGSWLVLEPWMLPNEWQSMGGQSCSDCSTCIGSEFALAAAFPNDVDQRFATHWSTWFTQNDVNQLQSLGINTVRIPLGYWIVEPLVHRSTEHYPRGGIKFLTSGLDMLRKAGIRAILDHHALPGVQVAGQAFTGHCTNNVQFYTSSNYNRALTWTAVMTFLTQLHPNYQSVFSIEAANEPIMNAAQTPGYGTFQKNFVKTVRAMECLIGVKVSGCSIPGTPTASNLGARLKTAAQTNPSGWFSSTIVKALNNSLPMLQFVENEIGWVPDFSAGSQRSPITTKLVLYLSSFMDVLWQYNNPPNPSAAAIGSQGYDHHLYYRLVSVLVSALSDPLTLATFSRGSFGGVAPSDPTDYLKNVCNRNDVQQDNSLKDSPMWYGEWALSTQFSATDAFLKQWADAQKLAYSAGAGWIFWSFKIEAGNPLERQWSYVEGVNLGYLTKDPSQYNDPNVCVPYRTSTPKRRHAYRRDH